MIKRVFVLLILSLLASGCSIRLSSSKVQDGGVFRSSDFGETWAQKVFVRQDRNRVITISNVNAAAFYLSPFSADEIVLTTFENGAYATTDGGESWRQTTLSAGHVSGFAYDPVNPALLYAAIGPNIFKSSDGGNAWEIIYTDTRGEIITALAVDRYDPSRMFAGTSGGTILLSINFGNDWTVKHNVRDPIRSMFFRGDDTRIMFVVTTSRGLERSTDGGSTWTNLLGTVADFPGAGVVYQVATLPLNPLVLYLATNYGVIRSADGGDTWEALQTLFPPNSLPVRTVALEVGNDQVVYFTVNDLLHKSEDGGKTWRTVETIPTNRLITKLFSHPSQPGLLFLGTFKPK